MKRQSSSYRQSGNALFLILIGVALFAALAYAVTQSSGGTAANTVVTDEAVILAAQVVQQQADVRAAITKMLIQTPAASITYCGPASPCNTDNDVFDSQDGGGGALNETPPPASCSPLCTAWTYEGFTDSTHGLFVGGVGSDAPEAMAILPNVTLLVCNQIQKSMGFASIVPPVQDTAAFNWTVITNTISVAGGHKGSASTLWAPTLTGQEFACVNNLGTGYFYYHVLISQ
jgi:hypothetical protein